LLRMLTAGESHGRALVGILEGMVSGLKIDRGYIDRQLRRRQLGYGRGGRMRIERDSVEILSGVRFGETLGSSISLLVENRDWENWRGVMDVEEPPSDLERITVPRPGHADLAGLMKYRRSDFRDILERSSARETAVRVALCSIARRFLEEFGIEITSYVLSIGRARGRELGADELVSLGNEAVDRSPVRCPDPEAEREMIDEIDRAKEDGDSVGGVFEIIVKGLPAGLGSHVHWDRRLDGLLAQALMSINGIKGVEIGSGFRCAGMRGSEVHDEIFWDGKGYFRRTNNAGGLEGGMTNGEPLVVRAAMKPIPTLVRPLRSVDISTHEQALAHKERSDVCAVPAASIVGEAMVAFVVARSFLEKFGGDSLQECIDNYRRNGTGDL